MSEINEFIGEVYEFEDTSFEITAWNQIECPISYAFSYQAGVIEKKPDIRVWCSYDDVS